MTGKSLMRLVALLGILGVTLYGVTMLRWPAPVDRAPVAQAPAVTEPVAARADSTPDTLPDTLPAAVRRLADSPVTGPARPQVLQDAVIDPAAVQPMEPARRATGAVARVEGASIRSVTANSANVRSGPSTANPVVGRLTRGEEVEVVESDPSGWVRIRIQGDGVEGWISARLLSN